MKREIIDEHLEKLAFSFFYKFSRFEFALKEHGYLRYSQLGCRATPGWHEFAKDRHKEYHLSSEGAKLIALAPKSQVVAANGCLEWKKVEVDTCPTDLGKIIRVLQTVRNNLFHGGKHTAEGWDDAQRTTTLVGLGAAVLDQIAEQTGLEEDYTRQY